MCQLASHSPPRLSVGKVPKHPDLQIEAGWPFHCGCNDAANGMGPNPHALTAHRGCWVGAFLTGCWQGTREEPSLRTGRAALRALDAPASPVHLLLLTMPRPACLRHALAPAPSHCCHHTRDHTPGESPAHSRSLREPRVIVFYHTCTWSYFKAFLLRPQPRDDHQPEAMTARSHSISSQMLK